METPTATEAVQTRSDGPTEAGPLAGIRVIDFTMAFAGPLSTMFLADMGADVIKVESADRPESLEMMRVALNRNKRSVALDLKTADGVQAARDLIATAQVVVSSFRPGVMDSFGLGAEDLLADRPDLVYATMSGYGEKGPSAHRRSMDKIAQAESGLMNIGEMVDHVALVDCVAGTSLASAIAGALVRRERTGIGGRVSGRLLDAALLLQADSIASFSATGSVEGTSIVGYPVANQFQTSDGPIFIAAYYDWHWQSLCAVLGLTDLGADERFATREGRSQPDNATIVRTVLAAAIGTWKREDLSAELEGAGVMATLVRGYTEVFEDPQVIENQTFIDAPHGPSSVKLVRPPFSFDGKPTSYYRAVPDVGADAAEVFAELGYSDARIDALKGRG